MRESAWTISEHDYVLALSDDGRFQWSVRVMLKTGGDPESGQPVGIPLSPASDVWTLV
jgi:hypothetical protein